MGKRTVLWVGIAATALACTAPSAHGAAADEAETSASAAEVGRADAVSGSAAAGDESPGGDGAAGRGCAFVPGIAPGRADPGMPRVDAGGGIEVGTQRADVIVSADGTARLAFEIALISRANGRATARVGYAFRRTGGTLDAEPAKNVSFAPGLEVVRCSAASPEKMHASWIDETAYATVDVEPGEEVKVAGQATFRLDLRSQPSTLLGFEDRAALNLKNFPWSFVRAPEYAARDDAMRSLGGEIALLPGAAALVNLLAEGGAPWMRAMSHEQGAQAIRRPGAWSWRFEADETPPAVRFEMNPGLEMREELALFEELRAARPDDLRVALRVASLLRWGGDGAARIPVLEAALAAWEGGAKAQLLTGRNDVRGAVYVALVRSLDEVGRRDEALARAREGLAIAKTLDASAEVTRSSVIWLERYVAKNGG